MIEETAEVTRISDGQVWIKSLQSGACGSCMQHSTCGTATLAKILPKREFAVHSDMTLQVGNQVKVAIDDSHLIFSSLLMYLVPLVMMLLAVGSANFILTPNLAEAWLPEIALSSLLIAFFILHRFQSMLLLHFCFKPQIVEKM
jgi:sigma-E factor negative regulatory protein RseC